MRQTDEIIRLRRALSDLADVVEVALDGGLFVSVDGNRPNLMALSAARLALDEVQQPGRRRAH